MHCVLVAVRGFSLVAASGVVMCGLLTAVTSLVVERTLECSGFGSCGTRNLPRPGMEPVFPH